MERATRRNRKQVIGRHVMQRRALYARAVKSGDLRAALHALRDEAHLTNLYPAKGGATADQGRREVVPLMLSDGHTLSRRERVVQAVEAELREDKKKLRVIQKATPTCTYLLPDTIIPSQMLHVMAQMHVIEQLESAGIILLMAREILVREKIGEGEFEAGSSWDGSFQIYAYLYRVRHDGWRLFTERLGIDGQLLIDGNYFGELLTICNQNLLDAAPEPDDVRELANRQYQEPVEGLLTAEDDAKSWWDLFRKVCPP